MNVLQTSFSFVRRWGVAVAASGALLWVLGASSGWYHTLQLRRQVSRLERALATLAAERNELTRAIRHHTSYATIATERYAREQLQLGKSNEVVYRL